MTEELKTMRELKMEHEELKEAYSTIQHTYDELDYYKKMNNTFVSILDQK